MRRRKNLNSYSSIVIMTLDVPQNKSSGRNPVPDIPTLILVSPVLEFYIIPDEPGV
jgi:hypothetical protein